MMRRWPRSHYYDTRMTIIALGLFALFIAAYTIFSIALVYHMRRYTTPHDPSQTIARVFIILSVIGLGVAAFLFFQVPWQAMHLGFPQP